MKALVCIDVQNDFVSGALGSPKAQELAPKIIAFAKECRSRGYAIYATADTHQETETDENGKPFAGYGSTLEGETIKKEHCIEGTWGHRIVDGLVKDENGAVIIPQGRIADKPSFGSEELRNKLVFDFGPGGDASGRLGERLDEILVCGFVTDICVVSNVLMLRAQFPNVPIRVLADLCAGTSDAMHRKALDVMRSCLVTVVDAVNAPRPKEGMSNIEKSIRRKLGESMLSAVEDLDDVIYERLNDREIAWLNRCGFDVMSVFDMERIVAAGMKALYGIELKTLNDRKGSK